MGLCGNYRNNYLTEIHLTIYIYIYIVLIVYILCQDSSFFFLSLKVIVRN